jgi:hypothetical protein
MTDRTTSTIMSETYVDTIPFRWQAAAVEVYGLTSCNQYPGDPVRYVYSYAINYYYASTYNPIPLVGHAQAIPWSPYLDSSASPTCNFNQTATADTVNLYHHP